MILGSFKGKKFISGLELVLNVIKLINNYINILSLIVLFGPSHVYVSK